MDKSSGEEEEDQAGFSGNLGIEESLFIADEVDSKNKNKNKNKKM